MPENTVAVADDGFYSIKEFAGRFNIGVTSIYQELGAGKLIAKKVRGRTLIPHDAARAWAQAHPDWKSTTAA